MRKLFFKKVSEFVGGTNLTITANSVVPGPAATMTVLRASVNITAGQSLYRTADNKWGLADANDVAPICNFNAVAGNTAAAGQPCSGVVKDPALILGATLVPGTTYILSATPGAICPDADGVTGWKKQIGGAATSATVIDFNPDNTNAVI